MSRHVVFGTGQVGHPLVSQLVAQRPRGRRGQPQRPGRSPRGPGRRRRRHRPRLHHGGLHSRRGRGLLLPQRHQLCALGRGVPAPASRCAGGRRERRGPPRRPRQSVRLRPAPGPAAGRDHGRRPHLDQGRHPGRHDHRTPPRPPRPGRVEVAIGRASDYFGPGATRSALGETVFGRALSGKTAQVMGDPDQPHSYSYTPDIAAALVILGTAPQATGEIWHLPVTETRTTRQVIEGDLPTRGPQAPPASPPGGQPCARSGLFMPRDARIPAHPLSVHRPVGRRRQQVPRRLRRPATLLGDALAAPSTGTGIAATLQK